MKKKLLKVLTLMLALSASVVCLKTEVKAEVFGEISTGLEFTLDDGTKVTMLDPTDEGSKRKGIESGSHVATFVEYGANDADDDIVYTLEYGKDSADKKVEYTKRQVEASGVAELKCVTGYLYDPEDSQYANIKGIFGLEGYEALVFCDRMYYTGDAVAGTGSTITYNGSEYAALFKSSKYSSASQMYTALEFLGFVAVDSENNIVYDAGTSSDIIATIAGCEDKLSKVKVINTNFNLANTNMFVFKVPDNENKTETMWGEKFTNYWYVSELSKSGMKLLDNPLEFRETSIEYFGDAIVVGEKFNRDDVSINEAFRYIDGTFKTQIDTGATDAEGNPIYDTQVVDSYATLDLSVKLTDSKNTNITVDDNTVKNVGANVYYATFAKEPANIPEFDELDYYFTVLGSQKVDTLRAEWQGRSVLVGREFNSDNLYVDVKYLGDNKYTKLEEGEYNVSSKLITKEGTNTFKVTFMGAETEFSINGTLNADDAIEYDDPDDGRTPLRIELLYDGEALEVESKVNKDKLRLYCHYENGEVTLAKNENVTFSGLTINKVGDNEVTASYKNNVGKTIVKGFKYVTVRFDSLGGTNVNNVTKKIGDQFGNLPTSTKPGYKFDGWYTDKAYGTKVTKDTYITGEMVVYAKWNANQYKVKMNPNGGDGSVVEMNCYYGSPYVLTENKFTRANYKFVGWSTNSKATRATYGDKATFSNLSAEDGKVINLYAIWDDGSGTHTGPGAGNTDPTGGDDDSNNGDDSTGGNGDGDNPSGGDNPNGEDGKKDGDDTEGKKPMDGNDPRYEVIDKKKDSDKDGKPDWYDNDDDNDGTLDIDDADDDGDGIKDEKDPDYKWLGDGKGGKGTPATGDYSHIGIVASILLILCGCLIAFMRKSKSKESKS